MEGGGWREKQNEERWSKIMITGNETRDTFSAEREKKIIHTHTHTHTRTQKRENKLTKPTLEKKKKKLTKDTDERQTQEGGCMYVCMSKQKFSLIT